MTRIEIHYSTGSWAALYVDGKLDRVGDAYISEERVFELLGVTSVHDDAFLRGQDQRRGVAQTLEEVEAYREAREARKAGAADLRKQAEVLLRKASALDAG